MSTELKEYLLDKNIASSRTTSYNPQGNGQVERYNGIIWNAIMLALKTKKLDTSQWELVLVDALHSVRSLLCTATNCTPHERMFYHARKSTSGESLPSWITSKGPVYLKRHTRHSKHDPLVEEVEILDANPKYAHVQFLDGRATTVSLKHLAPKPPEEINLTLRDDTPSIETENPIPVPNQVESTQDNSQSMPLQQELPLR